MSPYQIVTLCHAYEDIFDLSLVIFYSASAIKLPVDSTTSVMAINSIFKVVTPFSEHR